MLAFAVVAYALAAWAVTPGFYDGIAPVAPYRWVSPPAQFRASNQPALNGHATFKVGAGGLVNPGSATTQDGQASLSFTQGTFAAPAGAAPVTIDIATRPTFPSPGNVHIATNVYCVTSSSPMTPGKDALVTLQFSPALAAPSDVYRFQEGGGWVKIGNAGAAAPYFIAARTNALGCFAAGYVPSSGRTTAGTGISLPIVAALAIGVVVLAGVPLVLLRRRGAEEEEE
ncbi:MAG TPA: hypothetical protein VOB72_26125 [Candidatus Dormibacteraeota bacterium]|nr:hypothetical protein [Candidatus Dormibacteraeota bacterium]